MAVVRPWKPCLALAVVICLSIALIALAGCGGQGECEGATPVPKISSLSPNVVDSNALPASVTVNGGNFVSWSKVYVNGAWTASTYVSSSRLAATINADTMYQGRIQPGTTVDVMVENVGSTVGAFAGAALSCPNGGMSGTLPLTIR